MKIVFLGEDSFSAIVLSSLISAGHEIVAVYCPYYENFAHARLKKICEDINIPFYRTENINSTAIENAIRGLNPELIVVGHFQKLLKPNIFLIPSLGCINLHPSLLPDYKGLSPIQRPIMHGEKETGVTVHFIDEGVDTGKIIVQQRIPLTPDMYVSDLQTKLFAIYGFIVLSAIDCLKNRNVAFIEQTKREGSYYGKLKDEHCQIDLNKGHLENYNLIRGVSRPYFGAKIHNFRIWKASIASRDLNALIESRYSKCDLYFDEDFGAFIKLNDGSLLVEKYNKY
jgi:methionyl-tRNA formyltransferase